MKTDSKYHIFFQEGRDKPRMFTYGNRKKRYSEQEVSRIVRLLPKDHQVLRVIFCDPEEYLDFKRQRDAGNSDKTVTENLIKEHGTDN